MFDPQEKKKKKIPHPKPFRGSVYCRICYQRWKEDYTWIGSNAIGKGLQHYKLYNHPIVFDCELLYDPTLETWNWNGDHIPPQQPKPEGPAQ